MKAFSKETREENLRRLPVEEFDLLIIGGGINGAGAARDAAMRGMKVALIEANDFASGTSSRSSKMVHGGIRYLENLEFHLVFEALSERQKLFSLAPHLVHHIRFMLPLYETGRVGMAKMGLGMWAYDALSLFQAEMHEHLNVKQSVARQPLLQAKQLLGSYVYSDGYMDDDRLVHETLRSANEHGAVIVNYTKACGAKISADGKVETVSAKDLLSGREFTVKARHFLSTVGPWSDELGSQFFSDWKKNLRPTKGVHLTFEKNRLPLSSAVVMATEQRIVFGIPRHEMVIVGTTDTDFKGSPEDVNTDRNDVEYLLGVVDKYFPGSKIKESDIVASYAGVRPLVADGSSTEGKTSREHTIFTEPHGVTFVIGGKYTTYRLIAKQAIEHCLAHFSIEDRVRWGRCQTEVPINPLISEESFADREHLQNLLRLETDLNEDEIHWLSDRHGPECLEIVQRYGADLTYTEYEALHAIDNTMCLNLLDFMHRRVPYVLARKDHGAGLLEQAIQVFQRRLKISDAEIHQQIEHLNKQLAHEFSWRR